MCSSRVSTHCFSFVGLVCLARGRLDDFFRIIPLTPCFSFAPSPTPETCPWGWVTAIFHTTLFPGLVSRCLI